MSKLKRGLAAALSALLLITLLPAGALAADKDPGGGVADEVIYNLGSQEITVRTASEDAEEAESAEDAEDSEGTEDSESAEDAEDAEDSESAEDSEGARFDADGNYTIPIEEEDPFFPYEVAFTCNGKTTEEWFMDEDDTVEIGGHTFSVSCENGTPHRLGFYVGEDYVPAYPEKKEFTTDGVSLYSMLPLDNEWLAEVDFSTYLPGELAKIRVEPLLAGASEPLPADAQIVWKPLNSRDQYVILDESREMDLSKYFGTGYSASLELIVGKADPLEPTNKRYNVRVKFADFYNLLDFWLCGRDGKDIQIYNIIPQNRSSSNPRKNYILYVNDNDYTTESAYLGMDFGTNKALGRLTDADVTIYSGLYESMEEITEAKAPDITERTWRCSGTNGYPGNYTNIAELPEFTAVFRRDGEIALVLPFTARMVSDSPQASPDYHLYLEDADGTRVQATYYYDIDTTGTYTYQLNKPEYDVKTPYYLNLYFYHPDPKEDDSGFGINLVESAYAGSYEDAESVPEDAVNIKEQLFQDASKEGGGYLADFSEGVEFTVFDVEGKVHHCTVRVTPYVEPEPDDTLPEDDDFFNRDPYFWMYGAKKSAMGSYYNAYVMEYSDDSYYSNGYQTVLLLDYQSYNNYKPVTEGTEIYPYFGTYPSGSQEEANQDDAPVRIYAGIDQVSGERQYSDKTPVEFHNGKAIQYSAASGTTHLKNYWVTFLTQQPGKAQLFANGVSNSEHREDNIPLREVIFDSLHPEYHDIFIANIGDQELTGLSVTLEDAENVQLDPYWTMGGENQTNRLAGFTDFDQRSINGEFDSYGELQNVTKVRLLPTDGSGLISGTLKITSANGGEETVKLIGKARIPEISTATLVDGVKYVPYQSLIQTNNMHESDAVRFEYVSGDPLPAGLELRPNGELYGVPQVFGDFTFTVRAIYDNNPTASSEREFTLHIAENTNHNVWNATDANYDVTETVGEINPPQGSVDDEDFILLQYSTQIFETNGPFSQFIDFWLDGRRLTRGTDYLAEEGSTKITVMSQTLERAGKGSHTLAAEFRQGDKTTGTLKRAAQNYRINIEPANSGSSSSGSGSGSGSNSHTTRPSSGGSSSGSSGASSSTIKKQPTNTGSQQSTTTQQPQQPTNTQQPEPNTMPFTDVLPADWFYSDVEWAYLEELMVGMSGSRFGPRESISQATIVETLARMSGVDLTLYQGETDPDVEAGQWFTASAIWAKRAGLLPDNSRFTGTMDISRGQMAVMLSKYLRREGVNTPAPASPTVFADAGEMTEEENSAFQTLYQQRIFQGVGDNRMNPQGSTTRAEFSALLKRVSEALDRND